MELVFELVLIGGIAFFSAWLTLLSTKLTNALHDLQSSDDQLDEIRESIEIVATILNKLPEMMPSFNMNTNPLQPIFEAFAKKLSGEQPLMTYSAPERGSDGKFDGTQTEETHNTPKIETDD